MAGAAEVAALAKMPLTKDASWEASVVLISWPEEGLLAVSSMFGTRSGCRVSLSLISGDKPDGMQSTH